MPNPPPLNRSKGKGQHSAVRATIVRQAGIDILEITVPADVHVWQTIWTSSNHAIMTISSAGWPLRSHYGKHGNSSPATAAMLRGQHQLDGQQSGGSDHYIDCVAFTPRHHDHPRRAARSSFFRRLQPTPNNTTQIITTSATWTSSDDTIATITSAGLATGVGSGSATITAASGSVSGTAALTVQ